MKGYKTAQTKNSYPQTIKH